MFLKKRTEMLGQQRLFHSERSKQNRQARLPMMETEQSIN